MLPLVCDRVGEAGVAEKSSTGDWGRRERLRNKVVSRAKPCFYEGSFNSKVAVGSFSSLTTAMLPSPPSLPFALLKNTRSVFS
jgi:hypothetical protein